jgi:hypothetical protein
MGINSFTSLGGVSWGPPFMGKRHANDRARPDSPGSGVIPHEKPHVEGEEEPLDLIDKPAKDTEDP